MSTPKVAFLCVPGSWCPGYYFHKLTEKLQANGYNATFVDLPSVGRKDEAPGLQDDVAHVRAKGNALLDAGYDLILVGNSYGGFVVLESSKTLVGKSTSNRGSLKHMITINSPSAKPGQSMFDLVGDQAPIPKDSTDPWIEAVPAEFAYRGLFGSLPEEEGLKYGAMVGAQSMKPLLEPLTFAAYEQVPCTAIICGKDIAFKPETQHKVGSYKRCDKHTSANFDSCLRKWRRRQ